MTPARVTLHVWGVPQRHVPSALLAMGRERRPLRRQPGLTFGKLLGTGKGETFGVRDADVRHWATLTCWSSISAAEAFERSALVRRFDARAGERLRVDLEPLSSKGYWSKQQPFGNPSALDRVGYAGPVASLTRARIRPSQLWAFARSIPPVAADLDRADGLQLRLGLGDAPVGLQGTFSLWRSASDVAAFAYRGAAHVEVIRRTQQRDWYAEELFARFAVVGAEGTYRGTSGITGH
jgi:hypothetical protein